MNRSSLHGGPARGSQNPKSSQDARSSQHARSSFAVQPAINAGTFTYKKKAVKIVSAASSVPVAARPQALPSQLTAMPAEAAASLPTPDPSPAPDPAGSRFAAKDERPRASSLAMKPLLSVSAAAVSPFETEIPPNFVDGEASLEDMFARLSGGNSAVRSRPAKERSVVRPDKSIFSFGDCNDTVTTVPQTNIEPAHSDAVSTSPLPELRPAAPFPSLEDGDRDERESVYLHKAAVYLNLLPSSPGSPAQIIKAVTRKLHTAYIPNVDNIGSEEARKLQARIVLAVTKAVNKQSKIGSEPLTIDTINQVLRDYKGDFLQMCAALVRSGHIALSDLRHVMEICRTVLDILPKPDDPPTENSTRAFTVADKADVTIPANISKRSNVASASEKRADTVANEKALGGPLTGIKAWPTQEKREHGAIHRACVLKGVGGVKSLNQLQALVWGGRLESIQMPEPGSEHALVKFLTPEACQAYLDATENGIEVQGAKKKTVIFVDKQPGPASINDMIQNCIDGEASRCVRATGADDDWSDSALFKLARGKQYIPRDVDRIKQGKTARGHHFIEFRFGNIYHALNFRRHLIDAEEWEHCSIGYAKDPCELARGVHDKDADEEGAGFYA